MELAASSAQFRRRPGLSYHLKLTNRSIGFSGLFFDNCANVDLTLSRQGYREAIIRTKTADRAVDVGGVCLGKLTLRTRVWEKKLFLLNFSEGCQPSGKRRR